MRISSLLLFLFSGRKEQHFCGGKTGAVGCLPYRRILVPWGAVSSFVLWRWDGATIAVSRAVSDQLVDRHRLSVL